MRHLLTKLKIGQLFRSSQPRLSTIPPRPIPKMTDTIVPVRALWFSALGQWEYAPQAPYDSKASYPPDGIPASLTLVTWNVDFMNPYANERLTAALDYLQFHVFPEYRGSQPPPCLILLQEIKTDAFETLLAHPWVRAYFMVVPGSTADGWPRGAPYGTVTLVARSALLADSRCVHFGESRMWRNGLVTDVLLGGAEPRARVLRAVNTHLESLPEGTNKRVVQMGVIAGLLREAGTFGGIVGGDMNAIAPSDETLAEDNGLSDAWEHRRDGAEDGTTWGYQPIERFPPGRLDKILYTEKDDLEIKDVRRIAIGLQMPLAGGAGAWVSDHYGLVCHVEARKNVASQEAERDY
ncbi:Endonuclease/exonuclease/phosphatase [Lactifluus subvellereus]|nr:Endonuclease/exonuclease/phosphatase [Lactifluus subvellereus]